MNVKQKKSSSVNGGLVFKFISMLLLISTTGLAIGFGVRNSDKTDGNSNILGILNKRVDELEDKPFRLQLLHYSDIDGGRNIIDYSKNLAALAQKFVWEYPDNTLFLGSGDLWLAGSEYRVLDKATPEFDKILGDTKPGRGHALWANSLGLAASTFGNHEFDQSTGAIADIIKPDGDWGGLQFPYLVTNLDFSQDGDLSDLVVADGQDVSTIKGKIAGYATTMVNGEKIGLIGAIYPDVDKISNLGDVMITHKEGFTGTTFTQKLEDLASQIQDDVVALKDSGINKIIVMTHLQQIGYDRELASMLSDVDIIIGGGSNAILTDSTDTLRPGDRPEDTYPILTMTKEKDPLMIVNVDGDFTYLGRLVVDFDDQGRIIPSSWNKNVSGAYASTEDVLNSLGLSSKIVYNKDLYAMSDAIYDQLVVKKGNIIGYTNVYLNGERQYVRTEETNLGNLVIDSKVAYARAHGVPDALIGIQNGGGIRGPIGLCIVPPGGAYGSEECKPPQADPAISTSKDKGISELDIEGILKFNNSVDVLTVTGSQLKNIFEDGLATVVEGATKGNFPQISNLELEYYINGTPVAYDADGVMLTPGEKVKTLTITDSDLTQDNNQPLEIVKDGQLVEAIKDREFKLVVPGWLGAIGKAHDGYYSLGAIPQDKREELESLIPDTYTPTLGAKGKEQDAIAWYLKTNHGTEANAFGIEDEDKETKNFPGTPPQDQRITKLRKNP